MEGSPKDNDDYKNAFQEESEETSRNTTTLGNQVLLSVQQETLEIQQLPSGLSSETSLPSVPAPTPTSQTLNSDEVDESFSNKDVFHSSRKLRIRTKCSRGVDAVLTNRQHLTAFKYCYQESGRNIAALGNQLLPSLGHETSENQQVPPGILSETCSRPSVSTISSSSLAQDIHPLDETSSNDDAFYSSRDFRIRTNYSRSVDAILSPRQNRLGRVDVRLSPPQNLSTFFLPIPEQSDTCSAENDRRDPSPLRECHGIESSIVRTTRSLLMALRQETPTPSPEKWSVEKGTRPTSAKRKRTQSPESESDQWRATLESYVPKASPSVVGTLDKYPTNVPTQEMRSVAREDEVPESFTRSEIIKKRKTEIMESGSCDSNLTHDSIESYSNSSASVTIIDLESPTDPQTREITAVDRDRIESVTEDKSISSQDYSAVPNLLLKHSNPVDTNLVASSVDLSMEEYEATTLSNVFTGISLGGSNEDSRKRRRRSSDSITVISLPDLPEKESESLERRFAPTYESYSSNFESTYNIQIASSEDCQPYMDANANEFSSALTGEADSGEADSGEADSGEADSGEADSGEADSGEADSGEADSGEADSGEAESSSTGGTESGEAESTSPEETESASNMAYSATKIQMLESSQSRPIIENPVIQYPRGVFAGTEAHGIITAPSSNAFSSSRSSKQSSSANVKTHRPDLELETNKAKEGTDQIRSNSSTSTSEQNTKSKPVPPSKIRQMLLDAEIKKTFSSSDIKDSKISMEKNRNDPLLQRQHLDSISNEASKARERSEVGMDLDPPYLDVHEGQTSTSSYQPLTSVSADNRFSSSGVTASGEERSGAIKSNTSGNRISKYISNARKLLLAVLEEIMKFNEEKSTYRVFSNLFFRISVLSCAKTEYKLGNKLLLYLDKNLFDLYEQTAFPPCPKAERDTQEVYNIFRRIVVTSLISTLSDLNFDSMMMNYKSLKSLCEKCSQFWRDNIDEIEDEDSRNRVAFLKKMIQRLLLQTRNAFRELLVYIGENAADRIVDSYEEYLWEEDKSFLRRQLL